MPASARLPVVERHLDGARLTLPRAIHAALGDTVALSADLIGCVLLTPPRLWEEMLPILQECSAASHHATELFRFYAAGEVSAPVDERGRVTIPRLHMEWAGLAPGRSVIVVALGPTVYVWDPGRFSAHLHVANRQLRSLDTSILREQLNLLKA